MTDNAKYDSEITKLATMRFNEQNETINQLITQYYWISTDLIK